MSTSISIKELKELDPSSYQIVDIRDAVEISHGAIPGALVMKTEEIETSDAIDRSKKTIICCSRGRFSVAAAEELQEKGWDAAMVEASPNSISTEITGKKSDLIACVSPVYEDFGIPKVKCFF